MSDQVSAVIEISCYGSMEELEKFGGELWTKISPGTKTQWHCRLDVDSLTLRKVKTLVETTEHSWGAKVNER